MAQISDVVNDMVAQIADSGVDDYNDKAEMGDAGGDEVEIGDAGGDKAELGDAGDTSSDKAEISDAGGDKAEMGDVGDAFNNKAEMSNAGGDKTEIGDACDVSGDKAEMGDASGDNADMGDAGGDKRQMGDTCRDNAQITDAGDANVETSNAGGDKGQMSDACRDNAQITDAGNFNEATITEAVAQIVITDGGDKNEILDFDFADAMQDFMVDAHYGGLEACDDVGETLGQNVGTSGRSTIVIEDDVSNGIHEAGDKKRKRQDRVGGSARNKFRAGGDDVLNTVCFEFWSLDWL